MEFPKTVKDEDQKQCTRCGKWFKPVTPFQKEIFWSDTFCFQCSVAELERVLNQYLGTAYFVRLLEPWIAKYKEQQGLLSAVRAQYTKKKNEIEQLMEKKQWMRARGVLRELVAYVHEKFLKTEKDDELAALQDVIKRECIKLQQEPIPNLERDAKLAEEEKKKQLEEIEPK